MPISNRELDPSQRKESSFENFGAISTGVTLVAWIAPFPCELVAVQATAQGLSGSPFYGLERAQFVSAAGLTVFVGLAPTLALTAHGTSGILGFSLVAPGSTLLGFTTGDALLIHSGGANTAVTQLAVSVVVKALQDIKSHFGVST